MENLSGLIYPGRFIILGRNPAGDFDVVIYAVMGRSPSSQARRLELDGQSVWTRPTDPEVLKTGQVDLLVYPAIILGEGIAVSNGRQTSSLDLAGSPSPVAVLEKGLADWTYEPDAPIFTPRITGCILACHRAALSLIRRDDDGSSERFFFEIPLVPGQGRFVATYGGENVSPLPVFHGEPRILPLKEPTAAATAESVYRSLRPEGRVEDFRVAVAVVFSPRAGGSDRQVAVVNRQERTNA